MEPRDLIAAIATGAGTGAVGIVRLSGPGLPDMFGPLLGRTTLSPRVATRCRFLGSLGETLDDGLALYFPGPHSYTGQDLLELQGHGGHAVLEGVIARCFELGARPAQPGEFTYRAYLNGRMDLAQAEAVADLIEAKSSAAARSAVRALSGEFSRHVNTIAANLTKIRVLAEAFLDFPEEELEGLSSERVLTPLKVVALELMALKHVAKRSQLLRGARVVLAGPPNVGKSSLLNRLAGDDVAIVTSTPGTTRDVVRATVQLHGISVEFLDTAGLRESDDPIERLGMQRTRASADSADLILLVLDSTDATTEVAQLRADVPSIRVLNKVDLPTNPLIASSVDGVRVSAKTGEGIDALRTAISTALGLSELEEGMFLARVRHIEKIEQALHHLEAATNAPGLELVAEELRLAHSALGEVTGHVTSDDLLGRIFSQFCIGK